MIKNKVNRKNICVLDGEISFIEVVPKRTISQIPIFFAPGWGGIVHPGVVEIIKTLGKKSRHSIAIDHPHNIQSVSTQIPAAIVKKYAFAEVRKAAALLAFLEKMRIRKVDVLAHSEGAIYTLIAAAAKSDYFRDIILTNPVGLIDQDNLLKIATRRITSIISPDRKRPHATSTTKGRILSGKRFRTPRIATLKGEGRAGFILKSPITAVQDAISLANSHVHSLLRDLDQRRIRVVILACANDRLVHLEKLQAVLSSADGVDGFLTFEGGHTEILRYPRGYALAVDEILNSLNSAS